MRPQIDTSTPHAARRYDYYLGGKDHYAVDRETAQAALAQMPSIRTGPGRTGPSPCGASRADWACGRLG